MKKLFGAFFVLLMVVLASGCSVGQSQNDAPVDVLSENTTDSQLNNELQDPEAQLEQNRLGELPIEAQRKMVMSQRYVAYSDTAIQIATENAGTAVLFFHAAWCPTCRAAEKDIQANLYKIPTDVTIIKTDYDSMDELKKKYNITYQHTFVVVDAQGNEVKKWNGGELDRVLKEVQSI